MVMSLAHEPNDPGSILAFFSLLREKNYLVSGTIPAINAIS